MATETGSFIPDPIYTTGPDFFAVFETDDWGNSRGWSAVYESLDADPEPEPEPEPGQGFTSPNYPNNYPNNAMYTYSASASSGYVLSISFTSFDTEAGYDFLRVSRSSPAIHNVHLNVLFLSDLRRYIVKIAAFVGS